MNPEGRGHPPTPPASRSSIPSTSAHRSIPLSIDRTLRRKEWVFITWTAHWYWQLSASSKIKSEVLNNNSGLRWKRPAHEDFRQPCLPLAGGIITRRWLGDWISYWFSLIVSRLTTEECISHSQDEQLFTCLKSTQLIKTVLSPSANNQITSLCEI